MSQVEFYGLIDDHADPDVGIASEVSEAEKGVVESGPGVFLNVGEESVLALFADQHVVV